MFLQLARNSVQKVKIVALLACCASIRTPHILEFTSSNRPERTVCAFMWTQNRSLNLRKKKNANLICLERFSTIFVFKNNRAFPSRKSVFCRRLFRHILIAKWILQICETSSNLESDLAKFRFFRQMALFHRKSVFFTFFWIDYTRKNCPKQIAKRTRAGRARKDMFLPKRTLALFLRPFW